MKNVKLSNRRMTDKTLYKKLQQIARQKKIIHYQELAYGLGEPYDDIDERNKFHEKLGDITMFEHVNGRPMLSALVVVRENRFSGKIEMPGHGFFGLAKKIGVWDGKDKLKFFASELNRIYDCWGKK